MYIDPPDNNKPATSLSDVERDDVLVSLHLPKRTIDSLEALGRGLDLTMNEVCRRILATSLKTMLVERSI